MIKKVRIAVDHGNRNMKTCSQVFTTGLTIQDKKPARGEKFLFYEGKYYALTENRISYQRDITQDDRFFILTLFAIVKELEENPQIQPEDVIQVDLPIGLPPKHYAELCERYEAYFKRQGKIHDINYCGRTYHITIGDDDDKIRLNQRKPSKYKGLSRFGPEKNLQRINKFMKERPTFYKKLIQMKENFRFYLRCFYCITKVVILQSNSEKQDRISS